MKKLLLLLTFQSVVIVALLAQPVSDYSYKLDNGITIKTERCWNQVWVQQSYAPTNASDKTPLAVNIRYQVLLLSCKQLVKKLICRELRPAHTI
jgi:hypothetical protein